MFVLHEVFEAALVDLKSGRHERAAGGLCQILALWPDHADSWYLLGEVREAAGNRAEAVLCYRKAAGHGAARQALVRLADAESRRALAFEVAGKTEEAAACWGFLALLDLDGGEASAQLRRLGQDRVGEAAGAHPAPTHLGNFQIWLARDGLRRLQEWQSAGELAAVAAEGDRLLALNPNLPALLAQIRARAVEAADRAVTAALAAGDAFSAAAVRLRAMTQHGGEPKLIGRRRQVLGRLLELGRTAQAGGDVRRAERAFRQAMRLEPQVPGRELAALEAEAAARGDALLRQAETLAAEGRRDEAAELYGQAAAASLDPAPVHARLLQMRAQPVALAAGRLHMPDIGIVDFRNSGQCTHLRPAAGAPRGTVLVGFHREPVLFDDAWEHFQVTSINWESREVCRLFLRQGFAVDVVSFNDGPPADGQPDYAAVFGVSGFIARNQAALPASSVCIALMTGSSPDFQNRAEQERVAALSRRRQGAYAAKRQVADVEHQLESVALADHALLIGNAVTRGTFPEPLRAKLRPIRVTASHVGWIKDAASYVPASREFLWYFGHGAVLKGLDLLLDLFSRQDRWTLNVVGHVAYEPDFDQMYFDELYRNPRIRTLGHLRGDSPVMTEVSRRCFSFIAPSASEGMSNAVATCLQIGLYPIITRSCGIDLPEGCGIYLESVSESEIAAAVARAHAMPEDELVRQIGILQRHALEAYSRETYTREIGAILAEMLASR
jgi:tetratricopeptide (TPR) repeat protein